MCDREDRAETDPGQKRRSSRKTGKQVFLKSCCWRRHFLRQVLVSVIRRIRSKKSALLELSREDLVFIQIWLKDGFQRPWDCLLNETASHLFPEGKVWSFLQGCKAARLWRGRGRKSNSHCLLSVLPCSVLRPPKSPYKISFKKEIHKIKHCKKAKWAGSGV